MIDFVWGLAFEFVRLSDEDEDVRGKTKRERGMRRKMGNEDGEAYCLCFFMIKWRVCIYYFPFPSFFAC